TILSKLKGLTLSREDTCTVREYSPALPISNRATKNLMDTHSILHCSRWTMKVSNYRGNSILLCTRAATHRRSEFPISVPRSTGNLFSRQRNQVLQSLSFTHQTSRAGT